MRISNQQYVDALVKNATLGDREVKEIWLGDRKLYPSDEERAARLYVQLPDEGSASWCQWQHAIEAIRLASMQRGYVIASVAGYGYSIGSAMGGYHPAEMEGNVITFGHDEGPSLRDVEEGDVITMSLHLASTEMVRLEGEPSSSRAVLPILPHTEMYCRVDKGRKKTNAVCDVMTTGAAGEIVLSGQLAIRGHKRGAWTDQIGTMSQYVPYPTLHVQTAAAHYPHASRGWGWLVYPPLSTRIQMTITKMVAQS